MKTRQSRRPHLTTSQDSTDFQPGFQPGMQLDLQLAEYRRQVTALFAHHRHLHNRDGVDTCSCGGAWPCLREELAARLLDDWV